MIVVVVDSCNTMIPVHSFFSVVYKRSVMGPRFCHLLFWQIGCCCDGVITLLCVFLCFYLIE